MKEFLDKLSAESGGAGLYSPLNLAYIGDAVFDLCVRNKVVTKGNTRVNQHHKESTTYVSAVSQAAMYRKISPMLTEIELAVMKRGRNAKSFSKAKNASISDYRHATGLEALFGYLFLEGRNDRLLALFEKCVEGGFELER